MKITRLLVTGAGLVRLVPEFQAVFDHDYVFVHDPVVVLVAQRYAFRTTSDLQVTVVFGFTDDEHCRLEIVSGGGGAGLLNTSLGAEAATNGGIEVLIGRIALKNGWAVEVVARE